MYRMLYGFLLERVALKKMYFWFNSRNNIKDKKEREREENKHLNDLSS